MPELKEVFDMVTKQTEPDLASWNDQEHRQRRSVRNRKLGALTIAASIVVAAVVLALGALDDGHRTATEPTPTAYVSTGVDLYLLDASTGKAQPVLVAKGYQRDGEVSPDGTRVVFVGTDLDANGLTLTQIFVRDADGRVQQLTELAGGASAPTWSPDGGQIAFSSSQDIFVMNSDGTDVHRATGSPGPDTDPDWSPDGSSIVFWSEDPLLGDWVPDLAEIWLGSVSDGSATQLTRNRVADEHPRWSPDGEWIVFAGNRRVPLFNALGSSSLWLMRPDGTERHRVSGALEGSDQPTWSPDGGRIAYVVAGRLNILDVATGQVRVVWPAPVDFEWGPTGILVSAVGVDPRFLA